MKSKFFTLFAAFVLLFSANASAQVNGDVNGDGKVNEQDIAAILEIMAEAGGVKEQTKYYWYVGQTNPASIGEVKNKEYDKWTELGTDLSNITKIQIDTTDNPDYSFPNWYVLIPTSLGFKPYNADGSKDESTGWTSSTSTISGYTLWALNDPIDSMNTQFKK